MDLNDTIRVWRRRWILTLVLLTMASAGAAAALSGLPRAYTADSSIVLLASRSAARLNGGNPYLSFSPSLTLTADALSRELMAPGTINNLAARGYPDNYTVKLAPYTTTTTGSVLLVTSSGKHKLSVEGTLYQVTKEIRVKLAHLQRGVAANHQIRAATLSLSPQATLSLSQTARPLVAVIAPMFLLALGIPVLVDARAARKRIGRLTAMVPDPAPDPGPQPAYGDDRLRSGDSHGVFATYRQDPR